MALDCGKLNQGIALITATMPCVTSYLERVKTAPGIQNTAIDSAKVFSPITIRNSLNSDNGKATVYI